MLKLGIYCRTQPLGKLVCESKLTDLTEDGLLGMILRMVTTRPCQHQEGHRHCQEKNQSARCHFSTRNIPF